MIRRHRLRDHSINRLIPNMLTLCALFAGLTSIRFALLERWDYAVIAILISAVFDALDGRIARLLDSASKFGAELDSLSDFVSFGVAPAVIMFLWSTQEVKGVGWALVLAFSACMALRLARFNTKLDNADLPAWHSRFFTGVPAPAAAGLVLMPLIAWLEFGFTFLRSPAFVGLVIIGVAGLAVSRLPTFSFKRVRISQRLVLPTMTAVAIYASLLVSLPWATLFFTLLAYICTIPVAYQTHHRLQAQRPANAPVENSVDMDHD
ncbi:CDP-diacylglycerol--serine O-phosphatidyltransferase [Dongia sp.]|uniref:CDP-diacylglycerol--serine O-phosphatidyltransferase n=1 Tax=Dongia sp. TaxID=1977262 RepID=UPI0035B4EE93